MATAKHPLPATTPAKTPRRRSAARRAAVWLALLLLWPAAGRGELVTLLLQNGDRVTGEIIAEATNQVSLATAWAGTVTLPTTAIAGRTPAAAPVAGGFEAIVSTNALPPTLKRWKVEAQVGLDFASGLRQRQIYYGRLKVNYKQPYARDPRQFFRALFDESVEYGETDGVRSDNRLDGGVTTEADFSRRMFVYGIARGGYDQIRKIDLQYEAGPGLGYHLIQQTNLAWNVGLGADYQERHLADDTQNQTLFARMAEDFHWQISRRFTLEQKAEYFAGMTEGRARFEASLKYLLLENLSLNFTLLDLYDTQPAANVNENELRLRSSLGITF